MFNPDPAVETIPAGSDPATKHPRALAVRIGDRCIWLGNGGAANPDNSSELGVAPDQVVSLTRYQTGATTEHCPLSNAVINDPTAFDEAVGATRACYRDNTTTLVHCAAGISRSATVVATTLAAEEDRSLEAAIDTVQQYRHRANPHVKLRINACDYLSRHCDRTSEQEQLAEYAQRVTISAADATELDDQIRRAGGDADVRR
jgi:atypical dual specificity phosphatase